MTDDWRSCTVGRGITTDHVPLQGGRMRRHGCAQALARVAQMKSPPTAKLLLESGILNPKSRRRTENRHKGLYAEFFWCCRAGLAALYAEFTPNWTYKRTSTTSSLLD